MPNILSQILTGMIGLAGAIIVAVLAARFTAERFYKERTWERKANAYTVVFECLHAMLNWSSELYDEAVGAISLSPEAQAELSAEYKAARKHIRREIAGATWLLDARVEVEVNQLWRNLQSRRYSSWQEELDETYGIIANCQTALRDIARQDLALDKTAWWRRSRRVVGS